MSITIFITDRDLIDLFNPKRTKGSGGFQSLFLMIQKKTDKINHTITLEDEEIERIKKYYIKYRQGGWQDTLYYIFGSNILKGIRPDYVPKSRSNDFDKPWWL